MKIDEKYLAKMKNYDYKTFPLYLQLSIEGYIEAYEEEKELELNELYMDLYSSINIAQWDEEISIDKANELRDTFL